MITLSRLVERYSSRLDHCLYGIAGELCNVQKLRSSSPTLFAAICTVSALHDPQDPSMYEICNRHFRQLVSQSTFEKRDVEYIRALCICSFWLADASRILSSDAIRRAADLRLHRTFDTAFGSHDTRDLSPVESADRIRLWYLLFVCDTASFHPPQPRLASPQRQDNHGWLGVLPPTSRRRTIRRAHCLPSFLATHHERGASHSRGRRRDSNDAGPRRSDLQLFATVGSMVRKIFGPVSTKCLHWGLS